MITRPCGLPPTRLIYRNGWRGGCQFRGIQLPCRLETGQGQYACRCMSRRPDYDLAHVSRVTTDLYDRIRSAYQADENYTPQFLSEDKNAKDDRLLPQQRVQLHCYELAPLSSRPWRSPSGRRSNDEDLKYDILLVAYDAPISDHLGRAKPYQTVSQIFWWPRMYKWVTHYVKACETCQRVKPSGRASVPLQSFLVLEDSWKSMSLDFVFAFRSMTRATPPNCTSCSGHYKVAENQAAQLFLDSVFRTMHPVPAPRNKVDDVNYGPSTTYGQTERVNRVLDDTLQSIYAEAPRSWSDRLPMVAFALNNAVHASTGFSPFYLNRLRHPQVPPTLRGGTGASIISGEEARKAFSSQVSEIEPESLKRQLPSLLEDRMTLISRTLRLKQKTTKKEYCNKKSRENLNVFNVGGLVLRDTKNLPLNVVSSVESNKLKHRFIGPFTIMARQGASYTIDLPKSKAAHPASLFNGTTIRWVFFLGRR
ncbi:LOW QUALITY PROTEIN: Pol protein [Phytophthora palmivora]|uniref:Pol protein n=1 Tax=Phytophthora palmivora TaxID=4796 RepID=A0A2P4XVI7_9STRA|nr:LOW QUALITY PROTEIN: Pol protein [Phytophthora palmivora]